MHPRQLFSTLLCALFLLFSSTAGVAADVRTAATPRQAVAGWLTQRLHREVEASQILVAPNVDALEGCTIARTRHEAIGATSLSLHCPGYVLPQLVLVNFPIELDAASTSGKLLDPAHNLSHNAHPLVRVGATLSADWRTESLHAELPVVALDSGIAGSEIRVRIPQTNRIMRARILSAHSVTIVTGA
jgi:hypothetical protein